jgi:hypothetical protein
VKAAADNIRLQKEQFKQDKKMDAERAKLQKVADKEEKEAAKVAKKKAVLIVPEKPRPSHVTFGGIEYKVIDLGAEWTLAELKALIDAVKVIEEKKLHDVTFRLTNSSKHWLEYLPPIYANLMTKYYEANPVEGGNKGVVRLDKHLGESASNSLLKSKFTSIKTNCGNFKAAAPDGREQDLPGAVFPTGAANNLDGEEDERSVAHKEKIEAKLLKAADNQANLFPEGSVMLAAVKYYIEVFPNSIIGEGIKGEHVAASGIGRKFKNCDDLDGIHMYIYIYI